MTPSLDIGVLVVDGEGGLTWSSAALPAVAAVHLDVAPGIAVTVDAAAPAVILGWTVAPGAAPAALGTACDDPVLGELVDAQRAGGESVHTFGGCRLSPAWAHRALVAAVTRWILRPLDGAALLLDTAVAEHRVGHTATARQILAFADYALADLATDTSRDLPEAAADLVVAALDIAEEVAGMTAAAGLRDELQSRAGMGDASLPDILAGWRTAAANQFAGAIAMDGPARDLDADFGVVDPMAVPPRILAWNGAQENEVTATRVGAELIVRAPLAAGVGSTCTEANTLLAYVASSRTGELVALAPAYVEQRTVEARFVAIDEEFGDIRFGFFSAALEPRELRCDETGSRLADVDRMLLEAWNREHEAIAMLHMAGPRSTAEDLDRARTEYENGMIEAQTAAGNGAAALANILADLPADSALHAFVSGRLAAVVAYEEDLADPARNHPAPLLAELVAPDDTSDE